MSLLCITTVLLYIAASVYQFATLERIGDNPVVQQRNFLLSLLAVLGHAVILYQTIGQQGHLQLGFYNALSLTSFLVIAMILFTALTKPVLNISVLVMPFAALVIVLAELFPSDFQFQSGNFGLEIHILTSLVAYSLFTIAALQALLVSYQDKQLHAKHVTFRAQGITTAAIDGRFTRARHGRRIPDTDPVFNIRGAVSGRYVCATPGPQNSAVDPGLAGVRHPPLWP